VAEDPFVADDRGDAIRRLLNNWLAVTVGPWLELLALTLDPEPANRLVDPNDLALDFASERGSERVVGGADPFSNSRRFLYSWLAVTVGASYEGLFSSFLRRSNSWLAVDAPDSADTENGDPEPDSDIRIVPCPIRFMAPELFAFVSSAEALEDLFVLSERNSDFPGVRSSRPRIVLIMPLPTAESLPPDGAGLENGEPVVSLFFVLDPPVAMLVAPDTIDRPVFPTALMVLAVALPTELTTEPTEDGRRPVVALGSGCVILPLLSPFAGPNNLVAWSIVLATD
jgi:hypothetical protein